jgi:hypothetical protein
MPPQSSIEDHMAKFKEMYPEDWNSLVYRYNLGFYHLSSFRCSDLGCWVYYENTLPSPPRSEH